MATPEVARFLGLSTRSVRRLVERGALRQSAVGSFPVYRREDVLRCAGLAGREVDVAEPLLTPREAARRAGVAPCELREAARTGRLCAARAGAGLRFTAVDVEDWIAARTVDRGPGSAGPERRDGAARRSTHPVEARV